MQQYYIQDNKPASSSAKDLFVFCVKKVIDKNLLSESMMHNQWATKIFGYEKNRTSVSFPFSGNRLSLTIC